MNAWPGEGGDIMGPAVTRADTGKPSSPPLKNGNDLRESGYLIAVGSRTARFRRRHKNKILLLILLIVIFLLICFAIVMAVLYVKQRRHKPVRVCETKECLRSAANLALSMDRSVDPCDDFYKYVCGNWEVDHPRPDAYNSYDWFREKQTNVYSLVRDFLSKNSSHQAHAVQQAKDMYAACMNTEASDKRGLKPAINILKTLGLPSFPTFINATEYNYSTYEFDWLETVINVKTQLGMDVLIGFDIFTDPKNSSVYRLVMGSPETTNPFPSIYSIQREKRRHTRSFKIPGFENIPDETFNKERHIENADHSDDKEHAAQIYKLYYAEIMKLFILESDVAKDIELTETELDRNIFLAANEFYTMETDFYQINSDNSTDDDEDDYSNIPEYLINDIQTQTDVVVENNNGTATPIWRRYLEGVFNISDESLDFENDKILVSDPDLVYMALMASYLAKTPPVIIELYIWTKVVEVMSIHTTSEMRQLYQKSYNEAHSRRNTGTPPRSLQCASAVNDMMGLAVSYAIANPHFVNVTKPKIVTMLQEMKYSLARLVGKTRWMDDDTKLATYQKIIQMKTLIGFPDWLLEEGRLDEYYQGINIETDKHLENMINIIQVKIKKALNKFRVSNNYTWATDPTEVNAYHTFQENTITVPLVMLQYPFFDLGLDSLNYGSLGTILGHEITHGFDNFGRQFDKDGNLLPWWTNGTIDSFVNMTKCFVDQYSDYYVPELDKHIDGSKTLGENIADNGGLREAFLAMKEHLRKVGPERKLPGFEAMSSEQMFFLAFGNLWCGISTKDSLKADLEDEHSPQEFRARGALQNNIDFAQAWRCPPGSAMNPPKRCIIF